MDDQPNNALLLAFDTDDATFARGFELGNLWARLRANPDDAITEHVHASNVEMLARISEATNRHLQTVDLDECWLIATYWPVNSLDSP
jgi:hypothetical protein